MSDAETRSEGDEGARSPLSSDEESAVVAAIRGAERGNRGEVRVHLERRCRGDALKRAARVFEAMGMAETAADTGVLLYVAVDDRKAAVFAGEGVHSAAGPAFWQGVVDAVSGGFAAGQGADGLIEALGQLGDLLRSVVGGADPAGNELPDDLSVL